MVKTVSFLSKSNPPFQDTIRRGKNSITFKIMSKFLNGNKDGRQFWCMKDIFKNKGGVISVSKTCNSR